MIELTKEFRELLRRVENCFPSTGALISKNAEDGVLDMNNIKQEIINVLTELNTRAMLQKIVVSKPILRYEGSTVEVHTDGSYYGSRVTIDGKPIRYLRSFVLRIDPGCVPICDLEVFNIK